MRMSSLRQHAAAALSAPRVQLVGEVADITHRRARRARIVEPQLRCVASGYLSDGCSCETSIPTSVVIAAWARERRSGSSGEGFFHFPWRGQSWLAYGLADGGVRGVYCPPHAAQRDERSAQGKVAALPPAAPRPPAGAAGA